jgi:uncharacterized membrane-anchored protein
MLQNCLLTGQNICLIFVGNDKDTTLEGYYLRLNANKASVLFFNCDKEQTSLSYWEKRDPKQMLAVIKKNTEKENEERRKRGLKEICVIGWLQKPKVDKQTNTVFWAIEIEDVGERFF